MIVTEGQRPPRHDDGCLDHTRYDENTAWGHRIDTDLEETARTACVEPPLGV